MLDRDEDAGGCFRHAGEPANDCELCAYEADAAEAAELSAEIGAICAAIETYRTRGDDHS